jgi:hypothetical protein
VGVRAADYPRGRHHVQAVEQREWLSLVVSGGPQQFTERRC